MNTAKQNDLFYIEPTLDCAPYDEVELDEKVSQCIGVIERYMRDDYCITLAYSGGKDSSVMLDLTLRALADLVKRGVSVNTLHVMNSNTGLENPVVEKYTMGELAKIEHYAIKNNLPVEVHVATPSLSNDYLVNIIGGRTIMTLPGMDRKCQQMMKANPMGRMKKTIEREILLEKGNDYSLDKSILFCGTRRDESAHRKVQMLKRRESAFEPVKNEKMSQWTLSPIAEFLTDDIFTYIGEVVSNKRGNTYSDFEDLLQVYRDGNSGNCMVNLYYGTGDASGGKTQCGSRFGCFICSAIAKDKSMENMIQEPQFAFMKPLNDLREWLIKCHNDPSKRNWLSRKVKDNGYITISPVAYSGFHCLQILQAVLTIDANEIIASRKLGVSPRFQCLDQSSIIAIDMLWQRYGYQRSLTACAVYKDVYHFGSRYPIPIDTPALPPMVIPKPVDVPFCDDEYHDIFSGFRNLSMAFIDQENVVEKSSGTYANVNTDTVFQIDPEGAEMFFAFELDYALDNYYYDNRDLPPTAGLHYMFQLGFVIINKGGHGEWDRMLRVANQIHRHGIRQILDQPDKLVELLTRGKIIQIHQVQPSLFEATS